MANQSLTLMNGDPLLVKWAVKYDVFNMPEYIQGTYVGKDEKFPIKNGEFVRIHDIQYLDMKDGKLTTSSGDKFKLVGKGQQLILIDNELAQKMVDEYYEEFEEDS